MANEYYFAVNTDDDKGIPFGPVNKDNMDISRLIVDMACWLDPSESITHVEHLLVAANPQSANPAWQADYPLNGSTYTSVPDTYPLEFGSTAVIHEGQAVAVDVASGTPGLTYAVSFTATAGVSRRRRVVDVLVAIDQPLNPEMVELAETPPSYFYPLVVTASTILPYGFVGRVHVQNSFAAPITITLPPSPVLGHVVSVADIGRNADSFPVTFVGDPSAPQVGTPGVTSYVIDQVGFDVSFEWTGVFWHVEYALYPLGDFVVGGSVTASSYYLGDTLFAQRSGDDAHQIFTADGTIAASFYGASGSFHNHYRASSHIFQHTDDSIVTTITPSLFVIVPPLDVNSLVVHGLVTADQLTVLAGGISTTASISVGANISAVGWIDCAEFRVAGVPVVLMTRAQFDNIEARLAALEAGAG